MMPPLNPDLPMSNSPQLHPVQALLNEVIALQGRQQAQETRRARELLQHPLVHDWVLTEKVRRRLTSERHNIFEALGVAHKENYHSRFIGYLLNPSGEHDQGNVFLRALLQWLVPHPALSPTVCDSINAYLSPFVVRRTQARITTELDTGGYGRIDLVIELPGGTTIAIENKVYAGEQDEQLGRYWQWLRSPRPSGTAENSALIFLTPDGRAGTTSAAQDAVVRMSYADLAQVLEQGAATCPATASPLTQSVSQYTHLCRNIAIGSSTMTKPNSDIQKLLDGPTQLEAAFMLAEQLDEKKKAIPKEFALHVVECLNQKLKADDLYQKPWCSSLEPGNECIFGIGADGAFGNNYRCVVENYFNGRVDIGWRKVFGGQTCTDAELQSELLSQLGGKPEPWWLCRSDFLKSCPEAKPLQDRSNENILQLHQDNRDPEHPLAQRLAQEVWTLFTPFQKRMQALLSNSATINSSR